MKVLRILAVLVGAGHAKRSLDSLQNKLGPLNQHHIARLRGQNGAFQGLQAELIRAGGVLSLFDNESIDSIRARTNTFHTFEGGQRADIGIVDGINGPYLRTYADGQWTDNLLALEECPPR